MKDILAAKQRRVLESLVGDRSLLAFDFDGTLAPLVEERTRAVLGARTALLLAALCERHPCAIISGRSGPDVRQRLRGLRFAAVVGNHGAELSPDAGRFAAQVARARAQIERSLGRLEGVVVEDKGLSLAVHYRMASDRAAALEHIERAARRLPAQVRVFRGELVVNVVPRRAPDKGDAVMALRRSLGARRVLYVGDDTTDEDVFSLGPRDDLVSVSVGRRSASAAEYFVRRREEVDLLLARLVALSVSRRASDRSLAASATDRTRAAPPRFGRRGG